jgi:hypothetical protein
MLKLLVVAALLASNGDAQDASRRLARATLTAHGQLRAIRSSEEDTATASRTALHACLDDWAARPERLTEELLDVYDTATTAPLWPAERPPQAAMVSQAAVRSTTAMAMADGRAARAQEPSSLRHGAPASVHFLGLRPRNCTLVVTRPAARPSAVPRSG